MFRNRFWDLTFHSSFEKSYIILFSQSKNEIQFGSNIFDKKFWKNYEIKGERDTGIEHNNPIAAPFFVVRCSNYELKIINLFFS